MSDVKSGFADEPTDEARLISGRLGGISIVNTYIPQGYLAESQKFDYKLNWFERLRRHFKENFEPTDPLVWVGDLNVAPTAIDVYDPVALAGHVCYHPEVHKALTKIVEWGSIDVFRMHCKDAGQYTFWDYRAKNPLKTNRGWRLDHIMATRVLAEKSIACYIDRQPRTAERPSDHTPVVAEFAW
jgi:exodeoxyribonuclease-3